MTFAVGPLSRGLADHPDDIRRRASAAVRAAYAERAGEQYVMLNGAVWIVTARNSSATISSQLSHLDEILTVDPLDNMNNTFEIRSLTLDAFPVKACSGDGATLPLRTIPTS